MSAETGFCGDPENSKTMLTIDFGAEGNSEEFAGEGWSGSRNGFRWMIGVESELRLGQDLINGDYIIDLDLNPFVRSPALPSQRLTVSVNGIVVGESTVTRRGRFGYRIPAAALAARHPASIVFTHPDATRPYDIGVSNDRRLLAVSVTRLRLLRVRHGAAGQLAGTGGIASSELLRAVNMTPARFILNFESLGDNCEFGVLQRRCGAEPFLSLLRFAGMALPTLLRALDVGLEGFGDGANIEVYLDERREFLVREKRYDVFFHTFRKEGEIDEGQLHASESDRLAYFARRFVGDLKRGNKIFVVKRNESLQEDEILPLYVALCSYGPNVLLWMVPADADHASGSVEVVVPGLFKGFINRFAPYEDAYDLLLDDWLEVCANAYQLALADRVSARMGTDSSECQVQVAPQGPKIAREANVPS
jgi:hypothetical protein